METTEALSSGELILQRISEMGKIIYKRILREQNFKIAWKNERNRHIA